MAGSRSKANEVPELIPIITAHTINYKYKQHVSDSAGGLEDCCQRAGSMLIRIPLAMGYLGNSLSSHQFPMPLPGKRKRKRGVNSLSAESKDKILENGSLSLLSANIHINYKKRKEKKKTRISKIERDLSNAYSYKL